MNIKLLLILCPYAISLSEYDEYGNSEFDENEIPRQNITESEDLFEGDILIPESPENSSPFLRNMVRKRSKLWPGGIVPYKIKGHLTDKQEAEVFRSIHDFHNYTCIRFVPWTNQPHYIVLAFTGKCVSWIGKAKEYEDCERESDVEKCYYYQIVNVGIGCVTHEIMHALGRKNK